MKKLIACAFALMTLTACSRGTAPFDHFAQCLTDKGIKMYGADSCPHCQDQKKLFKGSFDLVDYVECTQDPKACQDANILRTPSWIIDGELIEGKRSLSDLAERSKCSLKAPEKTEEKAEAEEASEDSN